MWHWLVAPVAALTWRWAAYWDSLFLSKLRSCCCIGRRFTAGFTRTWAFLAIHEPFTLAATGLLIYVLARAARDLATLQGDAAATEVAESATHDSDAQSGQRMMVSGAIWLVGGLVVTIASYTLASSAGGGRFVLAYGAVIYGIAQIFRGMSRSAK